MDTDQATEGLGDLARELINRLVYSTGGDYDAGPASKRLEELEAALRPAADALELSDECPHCGEMLNYHSASCEGEGWEQEVECPACSRRYFDVYLWARRVENVDDYSEPEPGPDEPSY